MKYSIYQGMKYSGHGTGPPFRTLHTACKTSHAPPRTSASVSRPVSIDGRPRHSGYPCTVYDAESTETPLDLTSLLGLLRQRQTPAVQTTLFDASRSVKTGAASVSSSVVVLLLVATRSVAVAVFTQAKYIPTGYELEVFFLANVEHNYHSRFDLLRESGTNACKF